MERRHRLEPSSPTLRSSSTTTVRTTDLTGDATQSAWNGYRLSVACACGTVTAASPGLGLGAIFTVDLPELASQ